VVAAKERGVSTITKIPEAIKKSEATKLAITLLENFISGTSVH
jgi:hypothetical protein